MDRGVNGSAQKTFNLLGEGSNPSGPTKIQIAYCKVQIHNRSSNMNKEPAQRLNTVGGKSIGADIAL